MADDVGGLIAAAHAKRAGCPVCELSCCEPVIIERTVRNGDYFERLRCGDGASTFRRIWVGGYPKRESAPKDAKTGKPIRLAA